MWEKGNRETRKVNKYLITDQHYNTPYPPFPIVTLTHTFFMYVIIIIMYYYYIYRETNRERNRELRNQLLCNYSKSLMDVIYPYKMRA